jgi:hypothetical protein
MVGVNPLTTEPAARAADLRLSEAVSGYMAVRGEHLLGAGALARGGGCGAGPSLRPKRSVQHTHIQR